MMFAKVCTENRLNSDHLYKSRTHNCRNFQICSVHGTKKDDHDIVASGMGRLVEYLAILLCVATKSLL